LKIFAIKIAAFGLTIVLALPIGIGLSDIIYKGYQAQIEQTTQGISDNAADIPDELQDKAQGQSWIDNFRNSLQKAKDDIFGFTENAINNAKTVLGNFTYFSYLTFRRRSSKIVLEGGRQHATLKFTKRLHIH
jgi:predicted PurR-regulated permease PerM